MLFGLNFRICSLRYFEYLEHVGQCIGRGRCVDVLLGCYFLIVVKLSEEIKQVVSWSFDQRPQSFQTLL